ncbi:MAG: hypothetical protein ACE5OZ_06600 [Candidatus Heimdallarchaeota archaeon]
MMLKVISVIHRPCEVNIGSYMLRTGTGLDELGPLGLSSLFLTVSEITGQSTSKFPLIGIYGFGPIDDCGVVFCQNPNIRAFYLFEGAGTDSLPTLRDRFLRAASSSLIATFGQKIPIDCFGLHETQESTIAEAVTHVIPTHDLDGVRFVVPTHEVKFPIRGERAFSHQIRELDYNEEGLYLLEVAKPLIIKSIRSIVERTPEIFPYWLGMAGQLSEYMLSPPHTLALIFGSPDPSSRFIDSFAQCICFVTAQPLSLRFIFGVPLNTFDENLGTEPLPIQRFVQQI